VYGFELYHVKSCRAAAEERSQLKSTARLKWGLAALAAISTVLTGIHYWNQALDDQRASVRLLAAARSGDRIAVLMLLDAGGSANAEDDQKETPLMLAAERGDIGIARALLDAGANAGQREAHGGTALMMAVVSGNASLVELLIFWKADVNARRADGATALTLARAQLADGTPRQMSRRTEIVRMLRQARARE